MHPAAFTTSAPDAGTSSYRTVDLSGSRRVPIVMEMVERLSRASDPREVLRAFADGLVKLDGPRGYISLSTRGLPVGQYKITRMHTGDGPMNIDAADPWRNWNTMPAHREGLLGQIIRSAEPQLLHHLNVRRDPVLGDSIAGYGSMMAIPLFENGQPLNWSIQLREEPQGFSIEDLEHSILRSNLGGATVRNVMMTKQLREANEEIRREMERIAMIQRALLPDPLPRIRGLRIATCYETFDTAGGDLYDFAPLHRLDDGSPDPDGQWAMLIADASGHGPAAAVVSAMLNAIVYAYPGDGSDGPAAMLAHANRHLCDKRIEGSFVTAFLALFDPRTSRLRYSRAGHNPPLLKNPGAGGRVERLEAAGGLPLGITIDAEFDETIIELQPQQTLVLYTDGIPEAMNPRREMFGLQGIEAALTACTGEPECVVNSIGTALKEHEAGQRPSDDQTLVAMKLD